MGAGSGGRPEAVVAAVAEAGTFWLSYERFHMYMHTITLCMLPAAAPAAAPGACTDAVARAQTTLVSGEGGEGGKGGERDEGGGNPFGDGGDRGEGEGEGGGGEWCMGLRPAHVFELTVGVGGGGVGGGDGVVLCAQQHDPARQGELK